MYQLKNNQNRQLGFSLIELLIAMLISLILMAGVFQSYLGSKQAYRTQDGLSRLQENARFALDFMTRDLRMADTWGCVPQPFLQAYSYTIDQLITNNNVAVFDYNPDPASAGYPASGGIFGTEAGTTDSITIRGIGSTAGAWAIPVTDFNFATGQADLAIAPPNTGNVIISDCGHGDISAIAATGTTVVLNPAPTPVDPQTYARGATLYPVQRVDYQIGNGGAITTGLFRRVDGGAWQEVVTDVEQMQIQYHLTAGATYLDADDAAMDWAAVDSIRVSLTFRTPNANVATAAQAYTVIDAAGNAVDSTANNADRRLRRTFSTVVDVRGI